MFDRNDEEINMESIKNSLENIHKYLSDNDVQKNVFTGLHKCAQDKTASLELQRHFKDHVAGW